MPTYEYACTSCRRHTEAQQSFSDPPLESCPHCGGALRRVFHPVGIVLKGSGYYSTDNRGSERPAEEKKADEKGTDEKRAGEKKAGEKKAESKEPPPSSPPSSPSGGGGSEKATAAS